MTIRILIMVAALIASSGVFSSDKSQIVLTFVQFSSEEVVVYLAPEEMVAAQPQWVPGHDEAPLGVSKALEVARSHFPHDELNSIRLAKKEFTEREVWFYIFEFMGQKRAVVLMSGDLVESETVDEQVFFKKLRSQ